MIDQFVLCRESQIMVACSWRLDLPCGSDILSLILNMSDESYNFDRILPTIEDAAVRELLLFESQGEQFLLNPPRQSSLFLDSLAKFCLTQDNGSSSAWTDFLVEMHGLLQTKNISSLLQSPHNQVESSSLTITKEQSDSSSVK